MQKVLITGINGFIGAALAEEFCKKGAQVYGIDIRNKDDSPYTTFVVDMVNESSVDILREINPDIVIHCAGCADVNFSVAHPVEDFQGNVQSFHRLLFDMKICELAHTRVVFLSSAAVYGQPKVLPIKETTELDPISPYALHKKLAEDICLYFNHNYDFNIVIARIFSAYGPGLCKQIFWDMFQKIKKFGALELFGTGSETRDFIYKDDLVDAIILLATSNKLKYDVYNVANGNEITIREIAETFLRYYGIGKDNVKFTQTVREGNPINWSADISRLKALGYRQKVSLNQGVQNYVNWISDKS